MQNKTFRVVGLMDRTIPIYQVETSNVCFTYNKPTKIGYVLYLEAEVKPIELNMTQLFGNHINQDEKGLIIASSVGLLRLEEITSGSAKLKTVPYNTVKEKEVECKILLLQVEENDLVTVADAIADMVGGVE